QIAQHRLSVAQQFDPAILLLHPLGVGRSKLPSIEKRFDQRFERLDSGLEREEAPAAAFPAFLLYVDQGEELYVRAEERPRLLFPKGMGRGVADPRLYL